MWNLTGIRRSLSTIVTPNFVAPALRTHEAALVVNILPDGRTDAAEAAPVAGIAMNDRQTPAVPAVG